MRGELAAYRAVQEALTNTVRHAGPGAVASVELDWRPEYLVVRVDDARPAGGPDVVAEEDPSDPLGLWAGEPREEVPSTVTGAGNYLEGRGLRIVRERLEAPGGRLEAGPLADGFRTVPSCRVPTVPREPTDPRGRGPAPRARVTSSSDPE